MVSKSDKYLETAAEYRTYEVPVCDGQELKFFEDGPKTFSGSTVSYDLIPMESRIKAFFKLGKEWEVDECYVDSGKLTLNTHRDL